MAREQLEAFLTGATPEAETATVVEDPPAEPTGETEAEVSTAKPDGVQQREAADDDREPPAPLEGQPVIARRAYEDERRKRQDWRERATRAEAERDLLRRQMEEAKAAPPAAAAQPSPQPAPQQLPPIDLVADPQGFIQRVYQVLVAERNELEHKLLNDRLNHSEASLRDKLGDETVDKYVDDFQEFAKQDPSLWGKLYSQRNPYRWVQREIDRQRLHRDVGNDPEAFKAKLRAEWEAEQQRAATPSAGTNGTRPAPRLAPSLATARSVAGRSDVGFSGPPSLDDVIARPTKH